MRKVQKYIVQYHRRIIWQAWKHHWTIIEHSWSNIFCGTVDRPLSWAIAYKFTSSSTNSTWPSPSLLRPDLPTSSNNRSKHLLQHLDVPTSKLSDRNDPNTTHHANLSVGRRVGHMEAWSQAVVKPGGWTLSMVFFFVFFTPLKWSTKSERTKKQKMREGTNQKNAEKNVLHLSSILDVFCFHF